jgi:hypothetical protein
MRWPGTRKKERDYEQVIEEARSLLNGGIRATTYEGRWDVPAWVWVNQLAHTDYAGLVVMAEGLDSRHHSRWDNACRFLAADLLVRGRGPAGVATLQRVLIHIELDWLDGTPSTIQTPNELVDVVCTALAASGFSRPDL